MPFKSHNLATRCDFQHHDAQGHQENGTLHESWTNSHFKAIQRKELCARLDDQLMASIFLSSSCKVICNCMFNSATSSTILNIDTILTPSTEVLDSKFKTKREELDQEMTTCLVEFFSQGVVSDYVSALPALRHCTTRAFIQTCKDMRHYKCDLRKIFDLIKAQRTLQRNSTQ